jgi:hypothetical protein
MSRVDTEGILLVHHIPRDAPSGRVLTVPWIGLQAHSTQNVVQLVVWAPKTAIYCEVIA